MLIPNKFSGYQAGGIRLYPGDKGSSAAPPDPRLVEAQIKSMGVSDSAVSQIMQNSADMAPLQKQQLQFGLDSAKTAYGQSQDDRAFALGKRNQLSTLQDGMVNQAAAFNTQDKQNELAGKSMADVTQATSAAEDAAASAQARMGVDPNSGRALAMNKSMALTKASMLAGAGTMARTQARAEGRAMTDRASNALAGYPAMGQQTTGAGAGYGASGIGLANTGLAGMNSGFSAAAGGANGISNSSASMYGAMGNYNAQMAQSSGQGEGALMGSVATIGAAFL